MIRIIAMQKLIVALLLLSGTNAAVNAAEHYISDIWGQHACIDFRVPHLEFSLLYGRFNEFEGTTTMNLKEWGITYPLPGAGKAELPCRLKAFAGRGSDRSPDSLALDHHRRVPVFRQIVGCTRALNTHCR